MAYLEYFGIALIIVHTISILFITKLSMAKRLFLAGWIAMMVVGVPVIYNYLPFWAFALLCLSGLGIYVFLLLFQNEPDMRRSRNSASRRKYSGASEMPSRRYLEEQEEKEVPTTFARREQSSSSRLVTEETNDTVLKAKDFPINESGLNEQPGFPVEEVAENDRSQQEVSRVYTHETVAQTVEDVEMKTEETAYVAEETQEELVYTDFVMSTDPITFEEQDDKKTKAIKYALQVDAMLENGEQTEFIIPRPQVVKGHPAVELEERDTTPVSTDEGIVNTAVEEVEAIEVQSQQETGSDVVTVFHDSTSEEATAESIEPLVEKIFEEEVVEKDVELTETLIDATQETEDVASEAVSLEQLFAVTDVETIDDRSTVASAQENVDYVKLEDLLATTLQDATPDVTMANEQPLVEEVELANTLIESAVAPEEAVVGQQEEEHAFVEEELDLTNKPLDFELTPLDAETVEVIKVKIANDGPLSVEEQLDREFYFQFIMYEIKELVSLGMYQQTVDYLKEILIDSYDKNLRREALDLLEMVKIDMYDPKVNERIKKEYQQIKERNIL